MLSEEEIRNHYRHKCNTGFDPLLCVHLTYYGINGKEDIKHHRHIYNFVDRVITEDMYVKLITATGTTSLEELTDVDKLNMSTIGLPSDNADEEEGGIFWLKPPSTCKTLTGLFKVYEAKIKILFGTF